jgi:hypothetical protein
VADLREGLGAAPSEAPRHYVPTELDVDAARRNGFATSDPHPGFAPVDEPSTQSVQGAIEGAPVLDDTNSIEFLGERFRLAENVGMMPLLRYANASKQGLDSDDLEGMAAMYAMIRGIIHRPLLREPEKIQNGEGEWIANPHAGEIQRGEDGRRLCDETEWNRFVEFAEDMGAEGDELMELVGKAMGVIAARPRQRRAVSSTPSPTTSQSSRGSSSSPAIPPGRPDLAAFAEATPVSSLGR